MLAPAKQAANRRQSHNHQHASETRSTSPPTALRRAAALPSVASRSTRRKQRVNLNAFTRRQIAAPPVEALSERTGTSVVKP